MLALTLRKRLFLFVCVFLVCFFVVTLLASVIGWKFGMTTPSMRITTVLQDVILFILPPVITAILVTREPASLLCLDRVPKLVPAALAIIIFLVSVPAMNYIIWLNEQLPLPESLARSLRAMEDQAQAMVGLLTGPHTVGNLIMTIIIVGVFAGLSEELLFRGGLQRLLSTGGINPHTSIWVAAAVFSLMHMQFYGFVPRMLLGAFFGYTLYWTRSLWLPVLLHVLNNTLYIIQEWVNYDSSSPESLNAEGEFSLLTVGSFIAVVVGLWLMPRLHNGLIHHAHKSGADA